MFLVLGSVCLEVKCLETSEVEKSKDESMFLC